jgi:NAD(P)-dependent dehydrogenase (short-subunit alcohol dehydrogenase family)
MVEHPRIWLLGEVDYGAALAAALAAQGARVHPQPLAPPQEGPLAPLLERLAQEAWDALGGVDALVYLDRPRSGNPAPSDPDEILGETVATSRNLFLAVRSIAPRMIQDRIAGQVIIVCDVAGVAGRAGSLAASTAGAALIGMGKCLAKEFGRYRLAVNVVCRAGIEDAGPPLALTEAEQLFFKAINLGKPARLEHLANNIAHLSRGDHWMNGQVLHVNDGLVV